MGKMKKILLVLVVFISFIFIASCDSSKDYKIKNKSFVYSNYTVSKADDGFYSEKNPAGASADAVKDKIVADLYYNGLNAGSALVFSSDSYLSEKEYNGNKVNPIAVNKYKPSDYESYSLCGCLDVNGDGLSYKLLAYNLDSDKYIDKVFDLKTTSGSTSSSTSGTVSYYYGGYYLVDTLKYDSDAKTLTATVNLTYEYKDRDMESRASLSATFVVIFNEK